MTNTYGTSGDVLVIFGLTIFVFLAVLAFYFKFFAPFEKEREYIKMEMHRSYSEDEYIFWKQRLRRVYLRHIPFIGRFFR